MAGEYAFVMKDLRKVVPPKREILRGIWLSFFHGAKVGVLGANGAGKSSLLRIMAGIDQDFLGEAFPAAGLRIGHLPQEPQLDAAKDVRGNVEEGVAETRALLTRFEEVSAKLGEPLEADEMEKLLEEQARVQDRIEAANAWDLDRTVELAMDALRVPPGDADVGKISGGERRRVALCRLLLARPDMLLLDEPTNHLDAESVAWLERFLKDYPGTVVAITHDRYFLDNVAGWILELDRGAGIPWEGNYSSWLDQKKQRLAQEEKQESARQRTLEHELELVRMSPRPRPGPPPGRAAGGGGGRGGGGGGGKGGGARGGGQGAGRRGGDPHPAGAAPGRRDRAGRAPLQGVRRPAPDRGPELQPPARRHRRRHRRQRRGQDHALPHDPGAGEARQGDASRGGDGAARLRGPEPGRARRKEERVGGDLRRRRAAPAGR